MKNVTLQGELEPIGHRHRWRRQSRKRRWHLFANGLPCSTIPTAVIPQISIHYSYSVIASIVPFYSMLFNYSLLSFLLHLKNINNIILLLWTWQFRILPVINLNNYYQLFKFFISFLSFYSIWFNYSLLSILFDFFHIINLFLLLITIDTLAVINLKLLSNIKIHYFIFVVLFHLIQLSLLSILFDFFILLTWFCY